MEENTMKLQANQLRVGNLYWVLHEESEEIKVADWETIKSLQDYESNPDDECYSRGGPGEYYAGIPLTPEWLIRCGFQKQITRRLTKQFGALYILFDDECEAFGWMCHDEIIFSSVLNDNLKYVHQLQNLYFSLTGEELTLKP